MNVKIVCGTNLPKLGPNPLKKANVPIHQIST